MAKATLTAVSWKKSKPKSLKTSEIDKALPAFEKLDAGFGKGATGDVDKHAKAAKALKDAIAKDLAAVKKAKDKDGEKLLTDLQKQADAKAGEAEKYFEKGTVTIEKVSGKSGGGAPGGAPGSGGGSAAVEAFNGVVNAANTAWDIIKDGKPQTTASSKYCEAVPKDLKFTDLAGWKEHSQTWKYSFKNKMGVTCYECEFTLSFQHSGTTDKVPGQFLTNFNIFCKKSDVVWGYTVNANASVSGKPFNSGSKTAPIGAIPLQFSFTVETPFWSDTQGFQATAHGNGALEVK